MNTFITGGMFIGLLVMLFYTPVCLASAVDKMNDDVTIRSRILCLIPGFNIIRAEYKYFGKLGFTGISTMAFIVAVISKAITYVFMFDNITLNFVTVVVLLVSIALIYIANVWLVFTIIKDSDTMSTSVALLLGICFSLGQWYINNELLAQIRRKQNLESTFRG